MVTEVQFSPVVVPAPPLLWCCFPSSPLRVGAAWSPPLLLVVLLSFPSFGWGWFPEHQKHQPKARRGESTPTQRKRSKTLPPNRREGQSTTTPRRMRPSSTTQQKRGERPHHAKGKGKQQQHRTEERREATPSERTSRRPTHPPTGDSPPKTESQKKNTLPEKLTPCQMMPFFGRQRPMQVVMSGLLGERVVCVCVVNVFC